MIREFAKILGILHRLSRVASVLAFVVVPTVSVAQNYPDRLIRIVVPYAAGGAVDLTARLVAERLEPLLRQTIIIENRPGAAGRIAAEFVARAEPDGHTILYAAGADLTVLQGKSGIPESVRNLTPITAAANSVTALATRPGLRFDSMAELLAYIRSNPGKLTYGSLGPGSIQNLYGEYFKREGYDMLQVPYNGIATMMGAIVGGQIDIAMTTLLAGLPLANDGKIKILCVTQAASFEGAPDIPPITKVMPSFPFPKPFFGYYGPPRLPDAIISKLTGEINSVLILPEVKASLAKLSIAPLMTSHSEFTALVRDTSTTFQQIIKAADIQLQ